MATEKYKHVYVHPTKISDELNKLFDQGWKLVTIVPPCDAGPTGSVTLVLEKISK